MYSVRLVPRQLCSHAEVRGTVIARCLLIAEGEEALDIISTDSAIDELPSRFTKQRCELNIHGGSSRDYRKYSVKVHLNQVYPNVSWGKKLE